MIIDFHTHIFPDRIAKGAIGALSTQGHIPPHTDGTAAGLRAAMRDAGVDMAVNLPVLTKPTQFDSVCRFAEEMNENLDTPRRILSFVGMHPRMEDACERLYELRERGIRGIKIHPDYQGTFIDDEAYVRILACAKSLGLITVTHAGLDGAYVGQPIKCTPTRVLRLLDRLGGYDRLVLAHLGANAMYAEVMDTLAGERVYFDTAYSLHDTSREDVLRLVDKHGDGRILFATDSPWRNIREELTRLRSFGLSKESEARILGGNATELLGLSGGEC